MQNAIISDEKQQTYTVLTSIFYQALWCAGLEKTGCAT